MSPRGTDASMADSRSIGLGSRLRSRLPSGLRSALRRSVLSLPSRVILSVFGTALVTSLVVAWISTRSMASFLREEIRLEFPALLRAADERLDLWFAQRRLDMAAFAEGAPLLEHAGELGRGEASGRKAERATRRYLEGLIERFAVFEGLVLLDARGEPLVVAGEPPSLSAAERRQLAARRSREPREGWLPGRRVHVFSSGVGADGDSGELSLHGVVSTRALDPVLSRVPLGPSRVLYLLDSSGHPLSRIGASRASPGRDWTPAARSGVVRVREYEDAEGRTLVGCAAPYGRFGWSLVLEQTREAAFAPAVSLVQRILGINLAIAVAFSLVAVTLSRGIVRPILTLYVAARRITEGEIDAAEPDRVDGLQAVEGADGADSGEVGVLTRAFNEMRGRVHRYQKELQSKQREIEDANERLVAQNEQLRRANEVLEQLSITDGLTRLHNHRFFQEQLPREVMRSRRTGAPLSLVLIDIDDFKLLNDRHGHSVGDAVLRRVADVMSGLIREVDLLARYGGEEFALLASHTSLEGAVALAEKIRLTLSESYFQVVDLDGEHRIRVTISAGAAALRDSEKALFNDADRALYRAKASGKDCVMAEGLEGD